ncbi:MAG: hypothetical protein GKS01_07425 [Alphaproteobacteria bacterium]|nr:hypothetical protein [Alphaproteobacteria bacterium]
MSLKDDLLRKGSLPADLPPPFTTEKIADYFLQSESKAYLSDKSSRLKSATYNQSKRGGTRRQFSVVHPIAAHDLSKFVETNWDVISDVFSNAKDSLSIPVHTPDGKRALEIKSHSELEKTRAARLSQFRFIVHVDISRFYHTIYTHTLPWAFHGKPNSKKDTNKNSKKVFLNRADFTIQKSQDGQTIGIPVGPDVSRVFAEILSIAIDHDFRRRCGKQKFQFIRHVDDVWIGANSREDADKALWRYRQAIREFELDINEEKTRISSSEFSFSSVWPTEITKRVEDALNTKWNVEERLRAASEYVFSLALKDNDDGVLRYFIRVLDSRSAALLHWEAVEPFLKRCAVHFGHTIDYVVQLIVWHNEYSSNFDLEAWSRILTEILDHHSKLGNDSEICWSLYACIQLKVKIPYNSACTIVDNCGALSIVALLNCAANGLADKKVFGYAVDRFLNEDDNGPFWPVKLEWRSRKWDGYQSFEVGKGLLEDLIDKKVTIFDRNRVHYQLETHELGQPGIETRQPTAISHGLIARSSVYDEEEDEVDDPDVEDF